MGRSRGGKAKRPASQATTTEEVDAGSGDDEAVIPAYKRRGRPQRHFNADSDEEGDDNVEVEAVEDSDDVVAKPSVPSTNGASVENGGKKRRRRRRQSKRGGSDSAMEEKDDAPAVRQVGFRHRGSRRKSTPRRAAEAGVECK